MSDCRDADAAPSWLQDVRLPPDEAYPLLERLVPNAALADDLGRHFPLAITFTDPIRPRPARSA